MPALKKKPGEKKSGQMVRTAMHEMKRGKLKSGSKSGPKVTNPKQAVAIGLSEARKAGAKVPAAKKSEEFVAKYKKKSEKMAHRRKRNIGRS